MTALVERLISELQETHAELRRSRQLEAMRGRFDLYLRTHEVTDGDLRVARATLDQYVGPEHLEEFRQANDEVLVKILSMQRIYEFLMYVASEAEVQDDGASLFTIGYGRWMEELVWIPEFQLAHRRQARYYPVFARTVSTLMYRLAQQSLEAGDDSQEATQQAEQLLVTAVGQAAEELYLLRREDGLSGEEEKRMQALLDDAGLEARAGRLDFVNALEDHADHSFWAWYFASPENSA